MSSVSADRKEAIKRALWERVERDKDRIADLCSQLIRIPSENPPGDTREIALFLRDYLTGAGITCKVLGPDEEHLSVLGELGQGTRRLIFNGHTDVVPAGSRDKWDFEPFCGEIRDGMILGRGASDMKCGVAAMAYVSSLLAEIADDLCGSLAIAFVPDEETGGNLGTRWLLENGHLTGQACLIGEPTLPGNTTIGQKGALWVRLRTAGSTGHGSLAPFVGENAIMKLVKLLSRIYELTEVGSNVPAEVEAIMRVSKEFAQSVIGIPGVERVLDHTTVNVGTIRGGHKTNVIPDWAEVELDFRVPIGSSTQEVLQRLQALLKDVGVEAEQTVMWRSEPNYTLPGSRLVATLCKNIEAATNMTPVVTFQWASSDARFFRLAGIETAQYGPATLGGIHGYNERVSLDHVISCAKVYAGLAVDLLID